MKTKQKSLAELKGEYIWLRDQKEEMMSQEEASTSSFINVMIRYLTMANKILNLERAKKIGVSLALVFILGGCMTGRGLGTMVRGLGQDVETLNDGYMKANK